ncbi:MAG: PHP domain-containing protein [Corallococcus sp.]|nr:PHP domain-containing protein [Corallococcus sp.]MCM1359909.1 PHP domain-containing protein [Corallococcus sp.]MCM1395342.1 PHP domain-containing protein [Corallococcus sp.]
MKFDSRIKCAPHTQCDFHIHSNCSDGIFTPERIVEMACEKGLDCISLTDHDTVCGVKRAQKRAAELGIGFVVGTELSSVMSGKEVHVLAFNLDMDALGFEEEMRRISDFRRERNRQMQQKFDENGIDIDIASLKSDGSIGRGDIAREMVRRGIVKNSQEAFEKYLGAGKLCYVQTKRLTPVEAVQFALRFGAIPVLAHPKNLRMNYAEFERFLRPLVLAGLGGIEAQYFTHNNAERKFFCKMAKKYKLIVTGGSDFHDYTHGVMLGSKSFSPSSYTRTILGI